MLVEEILESMCMTSYSEKDKHTLFSFDVYLYFKINKCLQNRFSKFVNADQQDQEVVLEALSLYLQTNSTFSPVLEHLSDQSGNYIRTFNNNKSSILMEYFNINTDQNPSSS
jgi:hypothetical protein